MQTLPGAVVSRSWLKKLPLVLQLSNGSGKLFPSNIASYLQSLDSAAFRLLQCCLGKLWNKTRRQTSKTPKSCSASSNLLKIWRKCIAAVPKFNCKNLSTQRDIQKALMVFRARGAVFKVRGPNHLFLSVVGVGGGDGGREAGCGVVNFWNGLPGAD